MHPTLAGAEPDQSIMTQVFKQGVTEVVSSVMGKRTRARVLQKDIVAENGVIHVIDTVI